MIAAYVSRFLALRGIHYGWVMVALTFLYTVGGAGASNITGVLLLPMSKEFGWSIGDLSGPLGLRVTLFGLVAPFAAGLLLLYGLRTVLTASAALLIAGLVLTVMMSTKWQLWLSVGVLSGVASGMTALVLAATIANRWFGKRRGLVLGILSGGTATGQLIFLPVGAWLAENYGWRSALVPAAVLIAVLAAAFALLARNRPSDLGLSPYGEDNQTEAPRPVQAASGNPFVLSLQALRVGSRSLVFWILAFTFFICGVSSFGLVPHFVTLCGDFGIGPITSTGLLALIGVCDLIGTIGSGWLSDRYDNRWLLAWYYGLRGLSLLWLPYTDFTFVGLSFFAVFYGLDFIATVPPTVRLATQAFGREQAPLVFGWIFAAHQLGSGIMAVAAGESRDVLGSYLPAFSTAGFLCLAATLAFILFRSRMGPPIASARPA